MEVDVIQLSCTNQQQGTSNIQDCYSLLNLGPQQNTTESLAGDTYGGSAFFEKLSPWQTPAVSIGRVFQSC